MIVPQKITVISPPNIYKYPSEQGFCPDYINIYRKPVRFPEMNRLSIYVIYTYIERASLFGSLAIIYIII